MPGLPARVALLALAGCGSSFAVTQITLPAPRPCEPSPALPPLDPRFAPALSGAVALVSAEGDARLSATVLAIGDARFPVVGLVPTTWSADSSQVAASEQGWVTVWRASDGTVVDHIACPVRIGPIAMSADGRWIAGAGFQRTGDRSEAFACIIDRAAHVARAVPGNFFPMRFEGDTLVGVDRAVDLVSGATWPVVTVARGSLDPEVLEVSPLPGGLDPEGASWFAVSHDGRYVAGWTSERLIEVSSDRSPTTPPPPSFLAVWDRVAGKRLWRDNTRCCGSWRFSPDDQFLERSENSVREGRELLRVTTGEALAFPGVLFPVSPDGTRVLVRRDRGIELWSTEPPQPVVVVPRPRTIVARSRDGTVTAALDENRLVIEGPGRCIALGVEVRVFDAIEFSPDGRELYAGLDRSIVVRGDPRAGDAEWLTRRTLAVWRTETGEVARSFTVTGDDAERPPTTPTVFPMPAGGQVAFALGHELAVFDARTGRVANALASPWVSVPPRFAHHLVLGPRSELEQYAEDVAETFYGPVTAFASARHPRGHPPVVLAPDERHLAAAARGGTIVLWDRDRTPIAVEALHEGDVDLLAFSPDGRLLATGAPDGKVIVTRAASGTTLGTVVLAGDRPRFLWWSPDSARLVIDTALRFRVTVGVRDVPATPAAAAAAAARAADGRWRDTARWPAPGQPAVAPTPPGR
ncbi:MAG TPA: WD40 repeat domain-containing protein [Kofleriaceae bacterium]|jgi:WD40 repeat protein|nr:WD40 repeat domain-containing protein [Kofleriaceae bacterium]